MLRKALLYLSTVDWAKNIATSWGVARTVARRFVAGETLDEAITVAHALRERGITVTLDYLGESVHKVEDAQQVINTYIDVLNRIDAEHLPASISVKLTHLGYDISEELAVQNLRTILQTAKQHNIPVTIDMESTRYTDATLRIYRTMRDEYEFSNVGTVIQAYLRRTTNDLTELAQENAHIRLCKGAYLESAELAFPEKSDVDSNFINGVRTFLGASTDAYLCIATHDEHMITAVLEIIQRANISPQRYEFQMLYGIRTPRQEELARAGHTMRVYVPFGSAWYPYFVRRLAERPANLWFFAKSLFAR